ncbi:DegT/DnrJ/EryC1/StrS family aminotransferase [Limimaricola sp.]|uniref:DegT/DnrJ/EryC1/StrS family aminotransferase n=1 Tax=Limimaricola sp. TaxID=2211665 RepID=UPI004059C8FB
MYQIGVREMLALCNVVSRRQLMRYRGGENGYADRFEAGLRARCDVRHALAVNSGTSALIAALVGLEIGPGDEVIVPAYTWMATAVAATAVGATPVLCNIDASLTIDPDDIERRITRNTRAIIPVHMNNLVCDMDRIMEIARRRNVAVVEDASQAVGLSYKGRAVGAIGDAGVFSFNQFKNISAGEGGALLTNNEKIYARALMYHDIGASTRDGANLHNQIVFASMNMRVSELTAAVLYTQLQRLDGIVRNLRARRETVLSALGEIPGAEPAPHNDPENAVGLAIRLKDAEAAAAFAGRMDRTSRAIDSGRHIFTTWKPILERTAADPRLNPRNWAERDVDYDVEAFQPTLAHLARTCLMETPFRLPHPMLRRKYQKAAQSWTA